ncbi:hypothetical protein NE237_025204 [Protea cynaroides]|uniref:Glabrous enhancer-binding protein-like DBD domain-containing protein n=1 Tax=Protea cynaroides TaxID=273540 RepID=A0A9Q0H1Y0_9MAGN|nr:hypothetical protein NE237_025204 [Protea cynaroides]
MAPKHSAKEAITYASSSSGEEEEEVAEQEQSQEGKTDEEKTSVKDMKEETEDYGEEEEEEEEEEEDDDEAEQSKARKMVVKGNVVKSKKEETQDSNEEKVEDDDEEEGSKARKVLVKNASVIKRKKEEMEDSEEDEEEDEEESDVHKNNYTEKAIVKSASPLNAISAKDGRGFTGKEEDKDSSNDPYSDSVISPKNPIHSSADRTFKPKSRTNKLILKKRKKTNVKDRKEEADFEEEEDEDEEKVSAIKHKTCKDDNKDSKRRKKDLEEMEKSGEDQQRLQFQRVWDDDSEIILLEGMLKFCSKNDIFHSTDMDFDMLAFHTFIKKFIHFDVSKTQLSDKIRRLKKKYNNNASRGKGGKDPFISKTHEKKVFKLSKKIWGVVSKSNVLSRNVSSNGTFDWSLYPLLKKSFEMSGNQIIMMPRLDDPIINELVGSIPRSKLEELEEQWRMLSKEEIALCFKRVDLLSKQIKLFSTYIH